MKLRILGLLALVLLTSCAEEDFESNHDGSHKFSYEGAWVREDIAKPFRAQKKDEFCKKILASNETYQFVEKGYYIVEDGGVYELRMLGPSFRDGDQPLWKVRNDGLTLQNKMLNDPRIFEDGTVIRNVQMVRINNKKMSMNWRVENFEGRYMRVPSVRYDKLSLKEADDIKDAYRACILSLETL